MTLAPASRLGRYQVIAPIGTGGMGEVYRARDLRLDREVAVKVLSHDLASDASFAARFEREAKVIAALSHPNIISVFDFGSEGPTSYLVIELLDGSTLRGIIANGPMQPERVIEIALAICNGMSAAHSKGIVHRDLKPDNIFLTTDQRIKILDFGIAHVLAPPSARDNMTNSMSAPGGIKGTPAYMSPEQIRGEQVRVTSDLFSFGCVLFEMLTGLRAFDRGTAAETMTAVLREPPRDMRELGFPISEPLIFVIERCLEKDWRRRFQSAHDLALALRTAGTLPPSPEARSGFPRRPVQIPKGLPLIVASLVVLFALLAYVGRLKPSQTPRPATTLAVLPFMNLTSDAKLDYLSEGLTETITNRLSPLSSLRVMSRNSVLPYRSKDVDPRTVSRELNVDAVLKGRIRSEGSAILVSVELVDARDNRQIWGERYRRGLAGMSQLEEEISRRISEKLELQLTGRDRERLAPHRQPDPEAYRLYLQGRYEMNKRVPERMRQGLADFQQAIATDPDYALPHLGLAHAYVLFGGIAEIVRPAEAMPMAEAAAERALELDPTLAEAHAILGAIGQQFKWNWPEAEKQFRRAIQLDDDSAVAHQWYGMALSYRGRYDEALRELERAEGIDPMSLIAKVDRAQVHWMKGQYDESIAIAQGIVDLEPQFWLGHLFVGLPAAEKRDFATAIPALERAVALQGGSLTMGALGYGYGLDGRADEANRLLARLREQSRQRYMSPTGYFLIYVGLGDRDNVRASLEEACRQRSSFLAMVGRTPVSGPLRGDPSFAKYLAMDHPCAAAGGS